MNCPLFPFVRPSLCVSVCAKQWLKHVDEQGRPYYYSADGSRSEWELPKVRTEQEVVCLGA